MLHAYPEIRRALLNTVTDDRPELLELPLSQSKHRFNAGVFLLRSSGLDGIDRRRGTSSEGLGSGLELEDLCLEVGDRSGQVGNALHQLQRGYILLDRTRLGFQGGGFLLGNWVCLVTVSYGVESGHTFNLLVQGFEVFLARTFGGILRRACQLLCPNGTLRRSGAPEWRGRRSACPRFGLQSPHSHASP